MVIWRLLDTTNKDMAHYIGASLNIQIIDGVLLATDDMRERGIRTSPIQGIYPYDNNLMVKTKNSAYFFKPINPNDFEG